MDEAEVKEEEEEEAEIGNYIDYKKRGLYEKCN